MRALRAAIDDFLTVGIDTLHPIQSSTKNMQAEVAQRVRELRRLFPTGLVISPSHEALLPDIPPENVKAMAEAAVS